MADPENAKLRPGEVQVSSLRSGSAALVVELGGVLAQTAIRAQLRLIELLLLGRAPHTASCNTDSRVSEEAASSSCIARADEHALRSETLRREGGAAGAE